MHEGILEDRLVVGDKTHGRGEVIFPHGGLEVSGGFEVGFGLVATPLHKEAVGQAAEHAQNPQGLGPTYPAAVVVEGNVQALMEAIFNPPPLAVGLQPVRGIELVWWKARHEAHGLVLAARALAR